MVNYKNNQKVKIVGNSTAHGFPMGEVVTLVSGVTKAFSSGGNLATATGVNGMRWNVRCIDIAPLALSKKEIAESIKEYEASIDSLRSKLEFIEEVGSEEFDEDEFKIYNALKALDKKGTRIEKARALKAILNG
jgi:hypothetical protein